MASSGIEVGDEILDAYGRVKKRDNKAKTAICRISKAKDKVEMEREVEDQEWEALRSVITTDFAKEPVFAFHEFSYKNSEGNPQDKVICINWSPDSAGIKQKMLQSSTFDAVKKKVNHTGKVIEAHDAEDLTFDAVKEKCESK